MIRVEMWKWGERPHYRFELQPLGEDDDGVWMWAPAGNLVTRGEHSFTTEHSTVQLYPRRAWWVASWWHDHPELDLYVNINTEPVWRDQTISTIDLDLDVIRFLDGRVEIVDQDEFEAHQVEYGYPPDIIERAAEEAAAMAERVARRDEPFAEASRPWRHQAFR